jgi:hypothetical protein
MRDTNALPAENLLLIVCMDVISHYSQLVSLLLLATDCFAVKASCLLGLLPGIARKLKKTSLHVARNIGQIMGGLPMPEKE